MTRPQLAGLNRSITQTRRRVSGSMLKIPPGPAIGPEERQADRLSEIMQRARIEIDRATKAGDRSAFLAAAELHDAAATALSRPGDRAALDAVADLW